jgi:phage head maturation protease
MIRRGDLNAMSFAFRVPPGGEREVRTTLEDGRDDVYTELLDLDLVDVAAVARPAYQGTDLGVRADAEARTKAREAWLAPRREKLEAAKARAGSKKD